MHSVAQDVAKLGREVARRSDVDTLLRQLPDLSARLDALERATSTNAAALASMRATADADRVRAEHNAVLAAFGGVVAPPLVRAAFAAGEAAPPPSIGSPPTSDSPQ